MKEPQKSLKNWTKQKWRTKSGKPSAKTGERYLPEKAIKSLSSSEYAATTKAKREGTAQGKQFVKQPKKIAEKVKPFRAAKGTLAMKTPMNAGMKALKKKAPAVAKKMGYSKGGMKKTMGYKAGGVVQAKCGASYKG
jgi:hypothetical protein